MLRYLILCFTALNLWAQPIKTAFLVKDGVFNSELMAPFDILEHSRYRDPKHFFECFLVSPNGKIITTAEGLKIQVDFSCAEVEQVDVLVIPSTETSMDKDFEDAIYCAFIQKHAGNAKAVITLCDGAFALAHSGLLDGSNATTFPGDQDAFAKMFSNIQVHRDVWFVQDGKFITSVGGARSYEPALFLTQQWMGMQHATRSAQGLVIKWPDPEIAHKSFKAFPKNPWQAP